MADTTADQVAAFLDDVRKRWEVWGDGNDVPRLLAALEAVLEPHRPGPVVVLGSLCKRHENHRYFSITSTEAAGVVACAECTATVYVSCACCGDPTPLDSCPARVAISRELLGKDGT